MHRDCDRWCPSEALVCSSLGHMVVHMVSSQLIDISQLVSSVLRPWQRLRPLDVIHCQVVGMSLQALLSV